MSVTKQFLRVHWDGKGDLLLGYSGGPDSKALLYALLECGVKPHVAHVDHGWRKTSKEEALELKKEVEALGLIFISTRLDVKEQSEDAAREARYAFFAKIFAPYAALLLAHQAEDLAETVLKRVLEGAHISHFSGMQEVSLQRKMTIWRPFLKISREDILEFLSERALVPFTDPSNTDPAYLRARMRESIFPLLNKYFGKEVKNNLCLLSERALEIKEYLDRQIQNVPIQKGPWGTLVDLNGLEPIEQKHLLQKIVPLNRNHLHTLIQWLQTGQKGKVLELKKEKILVEAPRIWIFLKPSRDLESDS